MPVWLSRSGRSAWRADNIVFPLFPFHGWPFLSSPALPGLHSDFEASLSGTFYLEGPSSVRRRVSRSLFSLLRLIISKTNPEKLIYNSFYKVRGYMGTKVGNNPGIFLRAPALLLLFPVISLPTPGWRGFLRSLPADVLWPGCSVPTALYTLRAHT